MPPSTEHSIQTAIIKYLNTLGGCHVIKVNQDHRQQGNPDLFAVRKELLYRRIAPAQFEPVWIGQAYLIEVKKEGGMPTKLQIATMDQWRSAGAVAEVARSVEDVKKILRG